ncbi:uncharacterized protein BDV14DRAFT_198531 [Aspergillus stella-maris]|uniref:uncharacterized protein n=1 Tax=Aspergillus stella-maris TaxID=1810926 RepID=UPI003CCC92D5
MKATNRPQTQSTFRRASLAARGTRHDRLKGKHLEQLEKKYGEKVVKHNILNLQEQAEALRRPSLVQDIQGYDVYIGTSKKELYDNQCDTKIILHNRSTQKCQWFYTYNFAEEDQEAEIWMREENYFPNTHFMCNHGIHKIWLGAVSAEQREKLIDVWNRVPEQASREFAEEVLLVCARYGVLSGERIQAALDDLDEIMEEEMRWEMESE